MKRLIHHEPGSVLNVMTIELDLEDETKPHFNKDRDEVLMILEGEVNLIFDYGKSVNLSSKGTNTWHLIKANTTHKVECVSKRVKLLEAIGGVHKDDSCVISDFKN